MFLPRNKIVPGSSEKNVSLNASRGEFDGEHCVLSKYFQRKPRVTKRKNIFTAVVDFLKKKR